MKNVEEEVLKQSPVDASISDADYAEALELARKCLYGGGTRTMLAKALLRAHAERVAGDKAR